MNINLLLLIGVLIGATSGYLGSFMVVKRMSLVGDALSHVALPGIAIAIMFGINPMIGAFLALMIAAFGIWYMSEHSEIYPEALIGIFFTTSLSLGLLLTPEPELLEALFGNIDNVQMFDGIVIIISSLIILLVTFLISKPLLLGVISEDLAKAQKINIKKTNLLYLILISSIVALGVKFLGTLLTGALVIIPAVAARNISINVKQYHLLSIVFGSISAILGVYLAKLSSYSSGPIIVLVSVFIFILTYIFKRD